MEKYFSHTLAAFGVDFDRVPWFDISLIAAAMTGLAAVVASQLF